MKKPALQIQNSLDVEDYMDRFEVDEEKDSIHKTNNIIKPIMEDCQTEHVKMRDNSVTFGCRKAPTMIIESIQVGRPLKTLSLITNFAVIIFFFLSTAGSNWILTKEFRVGLWEECLKNISASDTIACNRNPCYRDYVLVFVICCMLGLFSSIMSTICLTWAMKTSNIRRKSILYNVVFGLHAVEVILFLISLIGYPVSFINDHAMVQRMDAHGKFDGMGWSYAMGWLGVIAIGISTGLLYFDKDGEEIIFYEKISRESCPIYV